MPKRATPCILVIDDEPDLLTLIELTLSRLGLDVVKADSVKEAKRRLNVTPTELPFDLCLTDMQLGDGTGLDVLSFIRERGLDLPTAVITAFGTPDNAVAALKAGAFDYLAKPVSLDQLRTLVKSALKVDAPAKPSAAKQRNVLLGDSAPMQRLRETLGKLARSNAPVFIQGESGTGKELAARSLHEQGPRASAAFVAVNCGAIPENLVESEFFGYRKGAFTGATEDRSGYFQAADGGTLFLDEVADLPLAMQVKLLRAIQERKVRRVGGTSEEPVDIRLVSATHKALADLVQSGAFRQDLFFRLNVIQVNMPPLRELGDDLSVLIEAILRRVSGSEATGLTPEARSALMHYDFPGNVRELENILERAVALADNPLEISTEDLQLSPPDFNSDDASSPIVGTSQSLSKLPSGETLQDYLDRVERDALAEALKVSNGNRTQAAKHLGITFRSMRYRLQRLEMNDND